MDCLVYCMVLCLASSYHKAVTKLWMQGEVDLEHVNDARGSSTILPASTVTRMSSKQPA